MEKLYKFTKALSRIAYIETIKQLEYLGGHIRQILFISALAIFTIFVRGLIFKNVDIRKEIFEVLLSYIVILLSGFVVIFGYYFIFKSSAILYRNINVKNWKKLVVEEPRIEVSNWGPDRTSLVHLHIRNKSIYKLTDCRVLINSVKRDSDANFNYPHIGTSLEWQNPKIDKTEISSQELINILVLNFDSQNDMLSFVSIPANSYNLLYGRYNIELKFIAYYWWKSHEEIISVKLVCPEYDKKFPMKDFRFELSQ